MITEKESYKKYLAKIPEIRAKLSKEENREIDRFISIIESDSLESFEGEYWVKIEETENCYSISNYSRIRRDHFVTNSKGIVKQNYNRGYAYLTLCVNNKKKTIRVHRLFGKMFIKNENPLLYRILNHKNGLRFDNRILNLEWCDNSHNQKESFTKNGRVPNLALLGKTGALCKNSKPVIQYDLNGCFIKEWPGVAEAARCLWLHSTSIGGAANGINKTSGGFKWKYKK